MVFGDNVRARRAARALPRTPTAKRKRRREEEDTPSHLPSPTALPPNTNHHRYSTMTQPCHKHTTLNQQYCDNGHTRWMGRESNGTQFTHNTQHTTHNPPPPFTSTHHLPISHCIMPPHTRRKRNETTRREQDNVKGRTQSEDGAPQHTPLPPFNRTTTQTGRGHQHTDGRVSVTAPTLHQPCHPTSSCHPPPNDSPTHPHDEGGAHRGYPTTRTPQTHTHHSHTTTPGKKRCAT